MDTLLLIAQEGSTTCPWTVINWAAVAGLLQIVTLAYVVYGFRRVAQNQTQLEEYLKRLVEKDEQ
jgi:hypothetical protein